MAYIIGEPIIKVVPTNSTQTQILVKFPVIETHTQQIHYRAALIMLDPEKLWVTEKDQTPPKTLPVMGLPPLYQNDASAGSYVESLIKTAEIQNEMKIMAEEEGIDLGYPQKITEWMETAVKRASDRCKERE